MQLYLYWLAFGIARALTITKFYGKSSAMHGDNSSRETLPRVGGGGNEPPTLRCPRW